MGKLANKVAVVTGASKGIGAGIAERLAADGVKVVVNYSRSAEQARALVARIEGAGGTAIAVKADISRPDESAALLATAKERFGGLDILVVVNISSGAGTTPVSGMHVYSSTKAAVDSLTRSLALELGPRNIRVVGIAPGATSSEGTADFPKEMIDAMVARTPLRRLGAPADIADAVAFVVSDEGRWITGETIQVGGGLML